VGKASDILVVDDFPYFTVEDAWKYLSERLDLTGCEQVKESDEMKRLEGRPRLTGMTVQILSVRANESPDKVEILRAAINESFKNHCDAIEKLLTKYDHYEVYNVLKQIVIAFAIDRSIVVRADTDKKTQQRFDLLESGVCHIRKMHENSADYAFLIEEPLTYTVIHKYVSEHAVRETKYTVMKEYMNGLSETYLNNVKGQAFVQLVAAALMQKDIMKTLLSNVDIYDRLGNKVTNFPPQLMRMQFHKRSNKKNNHNRSSLDLYDVLVNGSINGEKYIGDEIVGTDIIGVATVDDMKLSMRASCKFVTKKSSLSDNTISSDASVVTKYLWCSDQNARGTHKRYSKKKANKDTVANIGEAEDAVEESEAKPTKKGVKKTTEKTQKPKSSGKKRKKDEMVVEKPTEKTGEKSQPKPNATYDKNWTYFQKLQEKVDMTLLIGCVFPDETMDNKELLINIDASNMQHLFQDPVIVDVINIIIANKTQKLLQNDIKDKNHALLRK
jgi:hypothetical protein